MTLAVETATGRVPVVAATGSQSLAESRVLTEHALTAGADALLIVTPYYIRPPQRGLVAYYLELAAGTRRAVDDLSHPGPHGRRRHARHAEGRARTRSPHFVGIKQAVNDLGFVSECLHEFGRDFKVFVGLEELSFPMMTIGACGLMNAVGNLKPKVLAQMCEAVFAGDLATGQRAARAAARDQQGRVLRHEPDSDEVHDEEARAARRQRAPAADDERDAGARRQARRRARARGPVARMRLLSFAVGDYASFGAVNGDGIVDLGRLLGEQYPTLGAVLRGGELHRAISLGATSKATIALDEIRYLPTVPDPEKIICIGINYGNRNAEYKDGAEAPKYPSVFMRTPGSLVGHLEPIVNPPESEPARLRGRDRARDRQGGPPHRGGGRLAARRRAHADERRLGARLAAPLEVQRDAGQEFRALRQPRAVARHGRRDPAPAPSCI